MNSMNMGAIHISPDKKKIGFTRNERFYAIPGNTTANYGGFYDRFYAIKDGRVSVMNIDGTDFRVCLKILISWHIFSLHRMTVTWRFSAMRDRGIWYSRESGF